MARDAFLPRHRLTPRVELPHRPPLPPIGGRTRLTWNSVPLTGRPHACAVMSIAFSRLSAFSTASPVSTVTPLVRVNVTRYIWLMAIPSERQHDG